MLDEPTRLLFWVTAVDGTRIGHVGLCGSDYAERVVEIENVLRGRAAVLPGILTASTGRLAHWAFDDLPVEACSVRALADDARALRLYLRCGFLETGRQALTPVPEGDAVRWQEADGQSGLETKIVVKMLLARSDWLHTNTRGDVAA